MTSKALLDNLSESSKPLLDDLSISAKGDVKLPPLLALNAKQGDDLKSRVDAEANSKKRSKRVEKVDKRIQHLIEAYRKKDMEEDRLARRGKGEEKRNLRNKFGFSDSEGGEDDEEEEYDNI